MSEQTRDTEETIEILDRKLGMLKRAYDQYFLGSRPREPAMDRGEVQKLVAYLSNTPIKNTALRFKFSSICSRYQAHRRQWDDTLRKIEAGTYARHQFKARLRRADSLRAPQNDLYQQYVDARRACGQSARSISREKLDAQIDQQRAKLRKKFGKDAEFQFRVAIEDGRARVKAKRIRS